MARQRKTVSGSAASPNAVGGGGNAAGVDNKPKRSMAAGSTHSSSTSTTTTNSTTHHPNAHHGGGGGNAKQKASANAKHSKSASSSAAAPSLLPFAPVWLRQFLVMTRWHFLVGCICLATASYFGYQGYLETRVNTPFDELRIVQTLPPLPSPAASKKPTDDVQQSSSTTPPPPPPPDADRFWGTYRPGTYFGLKTRDPRSLVMGLMWFSGDRLKTGGDGIRHWCEAGDGLQRYGWNQHDGRTFGTQIIDDAPLRLHTSFVKFAASAGASHAAGDWTARISVESLPLTKAAQRAKKPGDDLVSLVWYTALDDKTAPADSRLTPNRQTPLTGLRGHTPGLGDFTVQLHQTNGTVLHESYLSTVVPDLQSLRQLTMANFRLLEDRRSPNGRWITLPGDMLLDSAGRQQRPNFIATMVTGRPPFGIDVAYQAVRGPDAAAAEVAVIAERYTQALAEKQAVFTERFEKTFGLRAKGYGPSEVRFAESAMSNMVGGIGYFYGASRVQSVYTPEPVPYWKAPLYTAVPSRSFFPRGFLWDEGFHGLLISAWDADIELDIMAHWFDLMNREGWIPREQILGAEALAKVPEEFVTQRNTAANPPTFFLTLKAMLARLKRQQRKVPAAQLRVLERMYPRLQAWFGWFNGTQRGEVAGTYRWRGRELCDPDELNAKTLTSGLDDYPRASHPTVDERHVDLRSWLAMAAGVMADLARLLDRDDWRYLETFHYLSDNRLLNEQHLSPYTGTYSDWGLHTDAVALKRRQVKRPAGGQQQQQHQYQPAVWRMMRVVSKQPEMRFVDRTFGYVSLFPFLLELLTPDAQSLAVILEKIRDPQVLWSKFGLRSLSTEAPLYMQRNTENDPPYWRGQIWLNINYLALKALHHYGSVPGPYAQRAREIYVELRQNVVRNVVMQYERTGFVWEQYNDGSGAGSGCKPFTGWSALTVLMMAEQY